jgi:hypothetical protein
VPRIHQMNVVVELGTLTNKRKLQSIELIKEELDKTHVMGDKDSLLVRFCELITDYQTKEIEVRKVKK